MHLFINNSPTHDATMKIFNRSSSPSTLQYSEEKLWLKLKRYAKAAGEQVVEKALLLYFASKNPNTPVWAKRTIYGALFYFINPFDVLTDLSPLIGYSDDLLVLTAALATIAAYIDDDVKAQAQQKLQQWFHH